MKGLVSTIALAAMIAFSSTTGASANVPTGYEVKGSTFYTLVNNRVVQTTVAPGSWWSIFTGFRPVIDGREGGANADPSGCGN